MKIVSKGTQLQREIASVFTPISQLISIDGPEAEVEEYDGRSLDSNVEPLPNGYTDPGEVSFEMFFDPALAGHRGLTQLLANPQVVNWKIVFSDNTEWPFPGFLKTLGPAVDMADGLKASGSLRLSGLVAYPA